MMSRAKKLALFFASSAIIGVPIASSLAQGAPQSYLDASFGYGGSNCATLSWHITRLEQADKTISLSGPIWYVDGSGMSFAQGTGQPDGHFTLNVKATSGNGPTGTITGQRMPDGSLNAAVSGSRCFAGTVHLAPGQTYAKM
jgi:hypothetical protein